MPLGSGSPNSSNWKAAPMSELDTIARQAGEAVRREARARRLLSEQPSPQRRGRVPLVLASLVLVALIGVVSLRGGQPGPLEIADQPDGLREPIAENGVLPVPAVGAVDAAYLDDLTPVFVSHPIEGEVLVLDARDTRNHRLVVFCADTGWFVDVLHHSSWSRWGDYTGGPTPTGLPSFPTTIIDNGRSVQVTGPMDPAPDRRDRRGPESPREGSWCSYGELGVPFGPDAIAHRSPASAPPLDGSQVPADRWVWATLTYGGTVSDPLVCDADGSCPNDTPTLSRPYRNDQPNSDAPIGPNTAIRLARSTPDGIIALEPADAGFPSSDAEVVQLERNEVQALAAAPAHGSEQDTAIVQDQTALDEAWDQAQATGPAPRLPDGMVGIVAVVGYDGEATCPSTDEIVRVDIFASQAIVVLHRADPLLECPQSDDPETGTVYAVAIPPAHADGITQVRTRPED
jgi:hypothetical protein